MPNILVVDDEQAITDLVALYLQNENFTVHRFYCGADALKCVETTPLDLAILDVMLPDIDGFQLCQKIREKHYFPIIMLTAKVEDMDKIMGLTLGADDYITKPFSGGELLARIRTALRHAQAYAPSPLLGTSGVYRAGDLVIDYDKHLVTQRGTPVHLTQSEYKIVTLLSRYSGKVLTYDFLLREIWGEKASDNTQNLRAILAKIRRKLEKNPAKPEYIFTEVGVGYRMRESE